MSEKFGLKDKELAELAGKIETELPSELAQTLSFKPDVADAGLILDFAVKLTQADYPLVIAIVKKYNGDFVNRKEKGKDMGYFVIPKPKPQPVAEKPKEEPKPAESPKPAEPTPPPAPAAEPEKPVPPPQEKAPEEPFKQPSPISLYRQKYCSACEDQGTCRLPSNAGQMQLCVRMLELQFLDGIGERLFKLGQILEALPKQLPQQVPSQQAQPRPSVPPTQPPKVPRDTNPREGIEEDGLVWVKVFDGAELKYLKATEKDNSNRPRFKELIRFIEGKGDKPYAKLPFLGEDCNCFLWVFNQGPAAIGKKKCRTPSGGRR
jgi:hypothetical protein